jgi:hypothetical protein
MAWAQQHYARVGSSKQQSEAGQVLECVQYSAFLKHCLEISLEGSES